ncbi:MAG: efflux RND transporter permease subunit [Pirellula sp.]|jgi:hydrophobe/amphiphile efflux-1 (HAE1) family protein
MISHFFIDRPIFSAVLSILLTLAGLVSIFSLPVAQYPEVTPPTVLVTASYPGANAKTVNDTVAAPIEQQVSGVENMLYMSSKCTNDGAYQLTITFKLGTDSDMAQVLVQNRVSLAQPVIPDLVQRQGINVKKMSPSTMMIVNLVSENGEYDDLYLSNYATIQIKDEIGRLEGVAAVTYLGQRDYSMRAWLKPDVLAAMNIGTQDVVDAISSQNVQVAAGAIGMEPIAPGQEFQLTINTLGRLIDVEQFGDIIVKANSSNSVSATSSTSAAVVRLRDIARIELGSQQYDQTCMLDGKPSIAMSIYQLPGSNALKTAQGVYKKMEELKKGFPEGVDYKIVYDTTPFIKESILEVFKTLRDAIVLVAIVVMLFLQNWRTTLIPLIAVPVAIIGTFAVMSALGFSLNNLSLFGLVLAIGIVVDDAIVVVENVERWLHHGLSPRDAARKAMDEVTGPVIAVALVLCSVFIPCAFISGITGQFFRQFAITIAVSTAFSAINSLTLSPALAAILMQPKGAKRDPLTWLIDVTIGWFFKLFNVTFDFATGVYARFIGLLLRGTLVVLAIYVGLLWLTYSEFSKAPVGFVPNQDKGYLMLSVQLPDSASVGRTREILSRIENIARKSEGVAHTVSVSGQSLLLSTNASNLGSMYVMLEEFGKRKGVSADEIASKIRNQCLEEIRDAQISIFGAPPIDGLGTTGGFKLIVEDRGNMGLNELQRVTDKIVDEANSTPGLQGVFGSVRSNTPWLYLDIDREKCLAIGVSPAEVFETLQVYLGSYYVNNFNRFGRSWQVNVMADEKYRATVSQILQLKVPNLKKEMVPLATLIRLRDEAGPQSLMRYNMYSASAVTGNLLPGTSSGDAIELLEKIAKEQLPRSMAFDWTELTYMQLAAGNTAMYVFALAVVFVFLVLAAQYESWSLPLAVILVVPMCLLCSVVGVTIAKMDVNIFTQIGLIVLVGLASKNAILIVEFAEQERRSGKSVREATISACRLRLRPILMTSFAFILGVVPLVIAEGAGAEMRRTLGTAVFSGMLGVTFFGILLTPVFYYAIRWFSKEEKSSEPSNTH